MGFVGADQSPEPRVRSGGLRSRVRIACSGLKRRSVRRFWAREDLPASASPNPVYAKLPVGRGRRIGRGEFCCIDDLARSDSRSDFRFDLLAAQLMLVQQFRQRRISAGVFATA